MSGFQGGSGDVEDDGYVDVQLKDSSGSNLQGQKTMAGSVPTVIASDQTDVPVKQATAANLNAQVVGNVANAASDSGNPVKVGGVYNTSFPTLTNGQRGDIQLDVNGKQITKAQLQDNLGYGINSTAYNSSTRNLNVRIGPGAQTDGYSRVRTVSPHVVLGAYFSASPHTNLVNQSLTGSATITHVTNQAALRLTASTTSGDNAVIQTKRYLRYNPGISYLLGVSGVIGAAKTNVTKRWGYYDANDGMFLEQTGTDLAVVQRTSTSGSPVDTRITQANWNLDKLDGTGPSGSTLDVTKHNLFIIDFVWQGAGAVRFGIMNGRTITYIHEILNSNALTSPWMRSPSRPLRAEILNTGTAASSTSMDITCMSIEKEGNDEDFPPETFTISTGVTKKSINNATPLPLLSIRPKATFSSITNRIPLLLKSIEALTVQDSVYVRLVLNGILTGASWTSVDTTSAAEYDTSATVISGGLVIYETFVTGGGKGGTSFAGEIQELVLGLNIAGSTQDTLTIAAAKINGNSDTCAIMAWEEYQ